MTDNIQITLLGGDRRQLATAKALVKEGRCVRVSAVPKDMINHQSIEYVEEVSEAVKGADVIVLPLPSSNDGLHLNNPLCRERKEIKLINILKCADKGCRIMGGKLPESFVYAAREQGFFIEDYFECEELQIKNAYTTAEAALSIAMNSLSKNVSESKIAVTGFGRISKNLCNLLTSLGADVTVAARKESDLAWARLLGCRTLRIDVEGELDSLAKGYDIIYNTVPNVIFPRRFLEKVDKKTLFVELASAPGGVDICAAKELNTNICWAFSLPGKYAPESAGMHIAESVENMIERGGFE